MKKFLVFTALLASSFLSYVHACSYYPYGDEVRFSFFTVLRQYYPGYAPFNYTSGYLSFDADEFEPDSDNINLWLKYCNNKISIKSVREAVLHLETKDITRQSKNAMVQYLYKNKDQEAIDYLLFAKSIEDYNTDYDNPWERDTDILFTKRSIRIKQALKNAASLKSNEIKARYHFLAIRLSYYSKDYKTVLAVYDSYFSGKKPVTIIDYWSLYFRTAAEKDPARQSYYAALVFQNAADKRQPVLNYFHYELPVADILKFATDNKEKAAIWQMHAMRKVDYALQNLQEIYKTMPSAEGLGFLLSREINKMEDWIYTPYYTYFDPVLRSESLTSSLLLERVAQDRVYAAKVLAFVNSVDLKKVQHPEVFKAAKAYLLLMMKEYGQCNAYTKSLIKKASNKELVAQLQMIQALSLTAAQQKGTAVILKDVQPVLLEQFGQNNYSFVFAIGRELEFLGNTTDAALLYSNSENVVYKSKSQHAPYYTDYYDNYFTYMDGMYTPNQMERFIAAVQNKPAGAFNDWLYAGITDVQPLQDLLGIKYIRINDLRKALAAFKKAPVSEEYAYAIGNNPFYELEYTPDFVERRDTIILTKAGITSYLIKCINKSADPNQKDRDYYAFLAANCYYNMGYYGNAWKMRRYNWSTSPLVSTLSDNTEYFSNNLAKYYYLQAYQHAKTKKFKALCFRMASKCRREGLEFAFSQLSDTDGYSYHDADWYDRKNAYVDKNNKYAKQFHREFSDYEEVYGGCEYFKEYFKARR